MNTTGNNCRVLLSVALLFLFIHAEATAATMEAHAGVGGVGGLMADIDGSYEQIRIAAIFPQWRRMDLFSGIEYATSRNTKQHFNYNDVSIKYSFDITAVSFGLRLKPQISERVHLFIALGGIAGKVRYRANFSDQTDYTLLSASEDSTYFIAPRIGFGTCINFSKQIGLSLEISSTGSAPSFNVVVANNNAGRIDYRKLNKDGIMTGVALGVRYTF